MYKTSYVITFAALMEIKMQSNSQTNELHFFPPLIEETIIAFELQIVIQKNERN